jgi:hypothetical protein
MAPDRARARLAAESAEDRRGLAADQAIDQQDGAAELAQFAGDQGRLVEAALPQAAAVERYGDGQPFAFELRESRGDEAGEEVRQGDAAAVLEGEHQLARGFVVERAGGDAVVPWRVGQAGRAD